MRLLYKRDSNFRNIRDIKATLNPIQIHFPHEFKSRSSLIKALLYKPIVPVDTCITTLCLMYVCVRSGGRFWKD